MTNELIRQSIETGELQLSNWDKLLYYTKTLVFFLIPAFFMYDYAESHFEGVPFYFDDWSLLLFLLIPSVIGVFIYRNQKSNLQLESVYVRHSRKALLELLQKLAEEENWMIENIEERFFVMTANHKFFSLFEGERITIIFDTSKIWINCIEDWSGKSKLVSKKRMRQNVEKVKAAVK